VYCGQTVGQPRPHCVRWAPGSFPPQKKSHSLPQFSVHVGGQTAAWIKMPLSTKVCLGPGDFVLDGDPLTHPPTPKRHSPQFWPMSVLDESRYHLVRDRCRPRRHCVRWGPAPPFPQKGYSPQFLADVYCDQTVRCIRMLLGTEVGLGPGDNRDIVLDGDALPPDRGTPPPQFLAHV